jgi:polysaccharide biosynthesis protein PslF
VQTRYGFVSTYPPTMCGLATFTAALRAELATGDCAPGRVIRLGGAGQPPAAEVVGDLLADDPGSVRRAAALLNEADVVIVQHEYGVYGGADGADIVSLLAALTVPSIVVLHTVLSAPTEHQREVLQDVVALAGAVVTMTVTARDRLAAGYAVDMRKVNLIPHGAPVIRTARVPVSVRARPIVLSWGLLGPGKGIEWAIEAIAALRDLRPAPRYVVAGQTHPKVLLREGEAYRSRLQARVHQLALGGIVSFDNRYRHAAALAALVEAADVVLLPYDSPDQVTSGVLIEAVAALKPVVATRFPHAVELLAGGAGLLVPHRDPAAIAAALRALLSRDDLRAGMTRAAGASAPRLRWPAVAQLYRQLAARLISDRVVA